MPISDEELAKEQERVANLRNKVAEAQATREDRERSLTNDITFQQLQGEAARLEAQLAVAKDDAKIGNVRDGSPLGVVTEQAREAEKAAAAVTDRS